MKHTAGPWFVNEERTIGDDFSIETVNGEVAVATVRGTDDFSCVDDDELESAEAETTANAHLVAAAPDLEEALKALMIACVKADSIGELPGEVDGSLIDNARKALEKANTWP